MSVGDTTNNSVLWVPGESQGKNVAGSLVSSPTTNWNDEDAVAEAAAIAAAQAYTDALHAKLTASGILP